MIYGPHLVCKWAGDASSPHSFKCKFMMGLKYFQIKVVSWSTDHMWPNVLQSNTSYPPPTPTTPTHHIPTPADPHPPLTYTHQQPTRRSCMTYSNLTLIYVKCHILALFWQPQSTMVIYAGMAYKPLRDIVIGIILRNVNVATGKPNLRCESNTAVLHGIVW